MNEVITDKKATSKFVILLIILAFAFLGLTGLRTISQSSIWMHLTSGRLISESGVPHEDSFSIVRAGQSWVDNTWLYDRVVYGVWSAGGAPLVTVMHIVLVIGAFLLLLPLARTWGDLTSAAIALVLSAWLMAPLLEVGPTSFMLLFVALFFFTLSRDNKTWVRWAVLIPAQILWTNIHPSFLLGPCICLLFVLQAVVMARSISETDDNSKSKAQESIVPLSILVAGSLIVTLINPYGLSIYKSVFTSMNNPAAAFVREWISPFSSHFPPSAIGNLVTLTLLIGAIGLITQRGRLPLALTSITVICAFLVIRSMRFLDIFALVAFPFIALSLSALRGAVSKQLKNKAAILTGIIRTITLLVILCSLTWFVSGAYYVNSGSAATFGLGIAPDTTAVDVVEVLKNEDIPQTTINMPISGGYLAWAMPGRQIFTDYRADFYGAEFYRLLFENLVTGNTSELEQLDIQFFPGTILIDTRVPRAGVIVRNLLATETWSLVYFDGISALLARNTPENSALTENSALNTQGLQLINDAYDTYLQQLKDASSTPVPIPSRLLGAASLFLALNQNAEAAAIYSALTRGAPRMAVAWLRLGICQLLLGDPAKAIDSFKQTSKLIPKDATPWLWMSRAYTANGDKVSAKQAFNRGAKLNPEFAAGFEE